MVAVTRVAYEIDGWGVGEMWLEGRRLVWHELPRPRQGATGRAGRWPRTPTHLMGGEDHPPPSGSTIPRRRARRGDDSGSIARSLLARLERYFAGARVDFSDVDLDLTGWTPFQLEVTRALRRVPFGEVVSYGELARLAGHVNAQRAAGTFCARNRYPLVLPCHRVVSAEGLGSYGDLGVAYKRRLLELEGVAV
jgi:methylated-DNA-[protein]-cysteine S-methyltransferase